MPGIPDAISVASPDTHCLIVAVPHDGPAEISSSLPRPIAADVLRQIADQLEQGAGSCGRALATGKPCPVHDRPTAPRPRGLDDLLGHLAAHMPDDDGHPADGEQPRPHPFAVDPAEVERARQQLGDAFAAFGRKLRTALEQAAKGMQQLGEQQAADGDPRPRIEVDLDKPADPEPVDTPPAVPTVVECAHGYGLMRDSCPGCDAEQERPHEADPVSIRPAWAKRDMRRCRRCGLIPSHTIHRAKRTA